MSIKAVQPIIASADDISYAVYCSVMDQMVGAEVAFEFKLPSFLIKTFGKLKDFINQIVTDFKIGIKDVIAAFKQHDVFALLKAVRFEVKVLLKSIHAFTGLIPKGLIKTFEKLHETRAFKKLASGAMKVDELMDQHPVLKKVAGLALAGFLLWIWLSMSFTGNPAFDFDMNSVFDALHGSFSIYDLFVSPEGMAMLTLLAAGMFTSIGPTWLGSSIYNLLVALVYTGASKLKKSDVLHKLGPAMHFKRVTPS
jgi:hypothetical protein